MKQKIFRKRNFIVKKLNKIKKQLTFLFFLKKKKHFGRKISRRYERKMKIKRKTSLHFITL